MAFVSTFLTGDGDQDANRPARCRSVHLGAFYLQTDTSAIWRLNGMNFVPVLISPLRRAMRTWLAAGHRVSAREALLRASNSYRTAAAFLLERPAIDPEMTVLSAGQHDTFAAAARLFDTPVQAVSIPYEDTALPTCVFLVDDSGDARPTIIYNSAEMADGINHPPPHPTVHAQTMNSSCIGTRSHSDVARRPRRSTPRRAALMFAGSIATISTMRPEAARNVVAGISSPTAPASSAIPVPNTSTSGRGSAGGTIAMRSFFIGVKCDIAVNTNIVASAIRALTSHVSNIVTPAKPSDRKARSEANNTISTSMSAPPGFRKHTSAALLPQRTASL